MGSDSERGAEMRYDITAKEVITPHGPGKFISYCPTTGLVVVEHDFEYVVTYEGEDVLVNAE